MIKNIIVIQFSVSLGNLSTLKKKTPTLKKKLPRDTSQDWEHFVYLSVVFTAYLCRKPWAYRKRIQFKKKKKKSADHANCLIDMRLEDPG